MRIALVTIAMTMLLLQEVKADIQPQKNFDVQRFAGKWYRVGLAYDSLSFAPYRSKLTISMGMVDPQPNGDVNMTMWTGRSTSCKSKVYVYEKTDIPGVFSYFSSRHNKVKDITVVDTNYTEYAIVFKFKKMNREYSQVSLYGRTLKLSPEVIEKFKTFSLVRGFPKDSILTPPAGGGRDTHHHTLAYNCPRSGN
ncbi:prostaglandin D2 synthase a isoform X2 [Alosa alosa]|uniref:prostaglandin D2 synthase a isoform X2 n=1 Tax=Alosa alosa TaxID=278164 RepID=UPI0020154103|nr:prostaglandin D2 synthase a isoform X2 [Alosa alosa]